MTHSLQYLAAAMRDTRSFKYFLTLASCLILLGSRAEAITIDIDFQYDTTDFFGAGNPSGATAGLQAKNSLLAAASFFSVTLTDSLDAIPFADPNTPGSQNTPVWRQIFTHPTTGSAYIVSSAANSSQDGLDSQGTADEFRDIQVAADSYVIYAGARGLSSGTLGVGGPGGFSAFGSSSFLNNIAYRGKPTDDSEFSDWGGSIAFDSDGSTTWHYNHLTAPLGGTADFYSVALHELGHALGLNGSNTQWNNLWTPGAAVANGPNPPLGSPGQFVGPNALAAYNSDNGLSASFVPTVNARADNTNTGPNEEDRTNRHWQEGTDSFIFGTTTLQETAMDPTLLFGTRKEFTNVDVGALEDIGWQVVPEPSSYALAAFGLLAFAVLYWHRRPR